MVQYRMRKEKDFENLQFALDNYEPTIFFVRPFSLGYEKKLISEQLENKKLTFTQEKGLTFLLNNKEILNLPLKDYEKGFAVEYHKENRTCSWEKNYHPMDPGLPKPQYSVLRTVIDDLLIEIEFKGKIKLEEDGRYGTHINHQYWKII